MAAANKFDSFVPHNEGSLINWLAKLAQNKITDAASYLRAQKRDIARRESLEKFREGDSSAVFHVDPADDGPSPAEAAAQLEDSDFVDQCLHELPEIYRELIVQRNYLGLSWSEVAENTERPSEGAARMMHAKALIELSKTMKRHRS